MKIACVLLLGLVLAACNAPDNNKQGQIGNAAKSGIQGTVTIGPTCPAQRPDDPSCDDRPYQAMIHVSGNNGVWVTQFQADKQGAFKIELEPGTYTLEPQTPNNSFIPSAPSQDVTVEAGKFTTVRIQYDSGIR